MQPVSPSTMAGAYDQGDAWHYNFMLPYDTEALIANMTKPVFGGKLEQLFLRAICINSISYLPNRHSWLANGPALFSPWAFAVAGEPADFFATPPLTHLAMAPTGYRATTMAAR